jgi:4-hydroxythreonine-4-phosphate dehydrogenase
VSPRLLVTPGDPRGVGPEVVLTALQRAATALPDIPVDIVGPDGPLSTEALATIARDARSKSGAPVSADAGAFAAESIERAVEAALAGDAHAIVTAPLHKPSLHASGRVFPGQTEMLASLAGVGRVGMLMAAEETRLDGPLRVLLATTHLALVDVPGAVTRRLLEEQISLLDSALRLDWGFDSPSLGLCALNPHASDGGLFGDEEERVLEPAVAVARAAGIDISGPLPADTVFARALGGSFDAVVAPYHDVGMAAFKTVSFGSGVNVTLGLPFVRTSPDHGTAFDIAGAGKADDSSMFEALRLASFLAENRFDTPSVDV